MTVFAASPKYDLEQSSTQLVVGGVEHLTENDCDAAVSELQSVHKWKDFWAEMNLYLCSF